MKYQEYRKQLICPYQKVEEIFVGCMDEATSILSPEGVDAYLSGATKVCIINAQGGKPVQFFMEEVPQIAHHVGEAVIPLITDTIWKISQTPNGDCLPTFIQSLPEAARRLGSVEQVQHYFDLILDMMNRTTNPLGHLVAIFPSPGLTNLLEQIPYLLNQLSLNGLRRWVDYGVETYKTDDDRQQAYFKLKSPDSRAMLQKEQHGTLFINVERSLGLYLQGLWTDKDRLIPYAEGWDEHRKPKPFYDAMGIRVPDTFDNIDSTDELKKVTGLDQYRAVLAHMMAHRRWSAPIVADNYTPLQLLAIGMLEDSRVEYLAIKRYPGLKNIWIALHPAPAENACDPDKQSCILHRLAMLSYAILKPNHSYQNTEINLFARRFHDEMAKGKSSTRKMAILAASFVMRTRRPADKSPNVYTENTLVPYRDDNRQLWMSLEDGEDDEEIEDERLEFDESVEETSDFPPRHYPEWNYKTESYRPDWTSVYEGIYPSKETSLIDDILNKHSALAKHLKKILDMLKPQNFVRVRYQEDGSELDLDIAIRSLIDFKSNACPDPRINMSHRHDNRDIAVTLLIDLSESINDIPNGCNQSILELSREAVTLLSWAIDQLGDPFSISGFFSNTRHDVRYIHLKKFDESFDDTVKGRLAGMEAGLSTRMGAAMRHAGYYLKNQQADKKLLLILTDGQPADIDATDEQLLIKDTKKAVDELDQDGIYSYCISLDPQADNYVSDIFGNHFSVIDNIQRLPEKLPELFLALTK